MNFDLILPANWVLVIDGLNREAVIKAVRRRGGASADDYQWVEIQDVGGNHYTIATQAVIAIKHHP
jgi:hypothetical protein